MGDLKDGSREPVEVLRKNTDMRTAVRQAVSSEEKIQGGGCPHCTPKKKPRMFLFRPVFNRFTVREYFFKLLDRPRL